MRKWMLNIVFGVILFSLAAFFLFENQIRGFFTNLRAFEVSDIQLYTLAGEPYRLQSGARGHIVFYADLKGCNACLSKISDLEKLSGIYDDIIFYSVLKGDKQVESFIQFMSDHGMPGELLMDPNLELYHRLGISDHPMLLFFNRHGLLLGAIPFDVSQDSLNKTYHVYIQEM